MAILDSKERILEIILTQYGRKKLSEGDLKVKYYSFFDDEVDYQVQSRVSGAVTLTPSSSAPSPSPGGITWVDLASLASGFSRASEASYFYTGSQEVTWFASGAIRDISSIKGEDGWIFVEGSSTNIATFSEEISAFSTNLSTVSKSNDGAPDLGEKFSVDFQSSPGAYVLAFGATLNNTASISVFHRSNESKQFRFYYRDNLNATTLSEDISSTLTWQRFTSSSIDNFGSRYGSFNNSLGESGSVDLWGFQVENTKFPTSYIRTSGSSAKRISDDIPITVPGNWINTDVFILEFVPSVSIDEQISYGTSQRMADFAGSNLFLLRGVGGNSGKVEARLNGVSHIFSSASYSAGDLMRIECDNVNSEVRLYHTGSFSETITTATTLSGNVAVGSSMYIGRSDTFVGDYFYGEVRIGLSGS